ncbi:MAG: ribonuclease P protein component [Bacteroidales bacterium]|nr:ribonuclease P protein component [Bacteroidales bacterium]
MNTLPKSERIKGKAPVSALLSKGRWGVVGGMKYCYLVRGGDDPVSPNRVLVSVPKRFFKRAVKRNLLKRRMREAYRTHKDMLPQFGMDLMLVYNNTELMDSAVVANDVAGVLKRISDERQL